MLTTPRKIVQAGAADEAMARGSQARLEGRRKMPSDDEPLLTRTWWLMGWDEMEEAIRQRWSRRIQELCAHGADTENAQLVAHLEWEMLTVEQRAAALKGER